MRLLQLTKYPFFFFIFFISCTFASPLHKHQVTLHSYQYVGDFSIEQARVVVAKVEPLHDLKMKYTLSLYSVLYYTPDPAGKLTVASGLVAMPVEPKQKVSIVSYQHGTRFNRFDIPSHPPTRDAINFATFGSSGGHMVVMPDYLGLGDSSISLHPYVMAETLASSSINMLFAAKELADELHYPLNDNLYLTGYSEGGFATNVMYEKLLKEYPDIHVKAVAPGSAPYDWKATLQFLLVDPGPRATAYLALFMYSMQTYNNYWGTLDNIFNKPYNKLVPALFDGKHQTQEILDALPKNPTLIFSLNFLNNIINGTDKHMPDLIANFNHYDYKPKAPMLLVGTKGDHDVPYAGAEMAYTAFKAKSDNIYLESVSDNLDHVQAYPFVTFAQLKFFQKYSD